MKSTWYRNWILSTGFCSLAVSEYQEVQTFKHLVHIFIYLEEGDISSPLVLNQAAKAEKRGVGISLIL